MATVGDPITIDLEDCNDCCDAEEDDCLICELPDQLTSQDIYATITAATGDMATVWFGTGGYVTLPHSFLLNNPLPNGGYYEDGSVEVCGGIVTAMSISAYCVEEGTSDSVCVYAGFQQSRDVTCVTEVPAIFGSSCGDTDGITITLDEVVCDEAGFVSVDFVADCGAYGTFSGTIHR